MNYFVAAMFGIVFCLVVISYMIYSLIKQLNHYKELFKSPSKQPVNVQNPEALQDALRLLDYLSLEEKELIIAKCFGRPIRIVKGLDVTGRSWFETITFWTTGEDQIDWSYHFNQTKEKDQSIG